MKLQQPDGFPVTFNLLNAAALTGESISTLRNNIARGILQHVGQIPFAGQERRFTVTGLLEIAIINALTESLPLQRASVFADTFLRRDFSDALLDGRISRTLDHAITLPEAVEVLNRSEFADTFIFDCNPHQWMKGPKWEDRDLSNPWLIVFLIDAQFGEPHFHMATVKGWQEIEGAYVKLARYAVPVLLTSVERGQPGQTMEEILPRAEVAMQHYPHMQVLNLTAILARIDQAIEQRQ